jgi:nucleoside-diphosphate-sugar epimerase
MKKILVTGARGLIGRHCLPLLLRQGFEVHGTSSHTSNFEVPGVQMHLVDLLDEAQIKKVIQTVRPSHLLHLAWITTPGSLWSSPENHRWVESSLSLTRYFKEYGGVRAVFSGTCAEYDWSYGLCSETTTSLNPSTLYGSSKKELFQRLQGIELNWAWGRVFHLYGPHEPPKKLVASVILSLLKGEKALCSNGDQIRDFLHVKDVASAFSALVDSSLQGPLNIASGIAVTLRSICLKIGEKMNGAENILFGALPPALNDPPILTADVKRIYNELAWKPSLSLDQGLDETIQWWKENFIEARV